MPKNDDELLAKAKEWLTLNAIDSDATVKEVVLAGRKGLAVNRVSRADDGSRLRYRDRWFLSGRRATLISVGANEDQFDEEGAKRFFESIEFDKKAND